jgi:hypothetical protein
MPFPPAVIMGDAIAAGNPDLLIGKFMYKPLTTKELFDKYYTQWEDETWYMSSIGDMLENKNFQSIVKMGKSAVPFIIEKLKGGPTFLVFALNYIFNERVSATPISIKEACELWLKRLEI